jgi:glucokinase
VFDADVVAIGCGVPSVVDLGRGVVYAVENIPSWRQVHLRDLLEERYRVPACIDNDANAFALGELRFGKGRGYRNLVGITLGTGLGAGVVIDGRLYSGTNGGAGELGVIPYREHTVEHYCAGQFFKRESGLSGEVLFRRAQDGDPEAQRWFDAFGFELGHAVMIALYAYDPELIVFGGSISVAFSLFEPGLRRRLAGYAYQHALGRLLITQSELQGAAVLGAAALCLDDR